MNGSHRQAPDSNCQFPRAGKGLSAHQLSDVAGFLNKKADGKHRWITHLSRNKQKPENTGPEIPKSSLESSPTLKTRKAKRR